MLPVNGAFGTNTDFAYMCDTILFFFLPKVKDDLMHFFCAVSLNFLISSAVLAVYPKNTLTASLVISILRFTKLKTATLGLFNISKVIH